MNPKADETTTPEVAGAFTGTTVRARIVREERSWPAGGARGYGSLYLQMQQLIDGEWRDQPGQNCGELERIVLALIDERDEAARMVRQVLDEVREERDLLRADLELVHVEVDRILGSRRSSSSAPTPPPPLVPRKETTP